MGPLWMIKHKNLNCYLLLREEPDAEDNAFLLEGPSIYLADFIAENILQGRTLKPGYVAEIKVDISNETKL